MICVADKVLIEIVVESVARRVISSIVEVDLSLEKLARWMMELNVLLQLLLIKGLKTHKLLLMMINKLSTCHLRWVKHL